MSNYRYEVSVSERSEVLHFRTMHEAWPVARDLSNKQYQPVKIEVYDCVTEEYAHFWYTVTKGIREKHLTDREVSYGRKK